MRTFLHTVDYTITTFVQRSPRLHGLMSVVTHWGHPAIVIIMASAVIVIGTITASGRLVLASALVILTLGISAVLKKILRRPRPHTDYVTRMRSKSLSFPSGHAAGAAAMYGLFVILAWQHFLYPWNIGITLVCLAIIFIVGVSRVYLGAHFPSDVLGGWALGVMYLASVIFVIQL